MSQQWNNGRIRIQVNTLVEAIQTLQALKQNKQELHLLKRQLVERQRVIRAQYTDSVRRRGMKLPGFGKAGRYIRIAQTIGHASARASLANTLAPVEQQRAKVESALLALGIAILQLEQAIKQGGYNQSFLPQTIEIEPLQTTQPAPPQSDLPQAPVPRSKSLSRFEWLVIGGLCFIVISFFVVAAWLKNDAPASTPKPQAFAASPSPSREALKSKSKRKHSSQ